MEPLFSTSSNAQDYRYNNDFSSSMQVESHVPLVDQIFRIIIYWSDLGLEFVIFEIYGTYNIIVSHAV